MQEKLTIYLSKLFMKNILVVGSGFSGAVIARELAERGFFVDVIDKRDHIAGNAYDFVNHLGIRIHKYGPHIFHTSNSKVVEWLSRFTEWLPYEHRVQAVLQDGRYVTLPPNAETAEIIGRENIVNVLFRPYTKKMWNVDLEEIDPNVINRVSIRDDLNLKYFPNDDFQAMPKDGYFVAFQRILDHPNINVFLNENFSPSCEGEYLHIFNSMPIDEYFDFELGKLPYRSIKFHHVDLPFPKLLNTSVVNFTHSGPFTRITEWKNFPNHGINDCYTSLTYEEPCDYLDNDEERFYPVKDLRGINRSLYEVYNGMVKSNMTFIGRCGLYAYLDMHQAISSSLSIAQKFIK